MLSAKLIWTNHVQPDEGNEWINEAGFLTDDEARRAARALTSKDVNAAIRAVVEVYLDASRKPAARYEYADGIEAMIFDDRVEPLFKFHGKLSSGDRQ